jgi:hypothetical protein
MIWEEILKILVNDLLIGLNLVIILYIFLHFVKKYVIPQIPKWIHDYKMVNLEKAAIDRARRQ